MSEPRIPEHLSTDRLSLERQTLADEPAMRALEQDPLVWPTLWGRPGGPSDADVRATLVRHMTGWEHDGFGQWTIRDRATGEVVGRGGLQSTRASGSPEVELAWAIAPGRQGEGLATELGRAALTAGFGPLGCVTLIAVTLPGNRASRRVMEKLGLRHERELVHAGLAHVLYRIDRADRADQAGRDVDRGHC